jgi:DNA-binding response OmpR family regulator
MENLTVLIVEDDSGVAEALSKRLQRVFSNVYTAPDGVKGLEIAFLVRPHIIVTDLRMPYMDGFEMVALLKEELPDIGVVMLTASDEVFDRHKADALGISAYLTKPLNIGSLVEKIREISSV